MKTLLLLLCCLLLAAGYGRTNVPPEFAARIDVIGASLMRGGRGFLHVREFAETDRLFDAIPEGAGRRAAALAFGDMLLALDLGGLSYLFKEGTVPLYLQYLDQSLYLMNRGGIAPGAAMDCYFKGLSKFRAVCLGVPTDGQRAGESRREFLDRRTCAHKLKEDYKLALSIFRRFWLPDLSRYFPPEYHDEFRRRLKAFELPEASAAPDAPSSRATSKP